MANSFFSGTVYIDTTSSQATTATKVKIAYAVFTPTAVNDSVVLADGTSSTNTKLKLQSATAKQSQMFDFSRRPILFKGGIFCSSISTGAVLVLYTTNEAAGT